LSNKNNERQLKRIGLYGLPAFTGDRKKGREKEKKIKGKIQDRS
jgi:hypothetical protein